MLYSTTFLTLDGVMADPHVWHPSYASPESLDLLESQVAAAGTMLIGRRTYEEFAAWWPDQGDDVPLARVTNAIRKDVVTSTLDRLGWNNAHLAGRDPVAAARRLVQDHGDVAVPGSATLVRALLAAGVLDEMRVTIDPYVAGAGSRLFPEKGPEVRLTLVDQRSLPNGVQYLAYRPEGGPGRG
ncbi:MAG TPA: dihydrofolate reductase family protein [Acidimicrobiales bacterium]|nr:dihydrofolate reductase family protein [Acidimicrobiales bacterium]